MDRIRWRDITQFEKIVREYQSMVYGIAYHFTHDVGTSEELAQDTFLHLYRNLDAIESVSHLQNWLRKAVIHRCIDHSRRWGSRLQVPLDDIQEPIASRTPGDFLLLEKVRQLVASLPETYRAIVILRFQEELEPQDIATLLQIPVNTVKSRLQRAVHVLRQKLESTLKESIDEGNLQSSGWRKIIDVESTADREIVEMYVFSKNEKVEGFALIAAEPEELTVVNILGPVDLNNLAKFRGLGVPNIDIKKPVAKAKGK